jgi:hypothetical protein
MKIHVIFILALILFTNCQKNEESGTHTTIHINDNIKNLEFNVGSYWVYQSDSLDQTDSTYIYRTTHDYYEIGNGLNTIVSHEYFSMEYSSYINKGVSSTSNYFIEGTRMLKNPEVRYPYAWGPVLFSTDTTFDWMIPTSEHKYLDSLIISNRTFFKVQESRFSDNEISFIYYTVKDIGVVRRVVTVDSISQGWNLLRWGLVK